MVVALLTDLRGRAVQTVLRAADAGVFEKREAERADFVVPEAFEFFEQKRVYVKRGYEVICSFNESLI